jgi:hypothetical protein
MSLTSEMFGEKSVVFIDMIRGLIPKLKCSVPDYYQWVSDTCWEKSPTLGHFSYWNEIFGRAYIAAAASLIRHNQWISGAEACYQSHSYLGLCSCIRGLVESTADTMYTLECFPLTVAPYWSDLKKVLKQEKVNTFLGAEDLENKLIHFTYARRVSKGEDAPQSHNALSNRAYIDIIKKADPELEKLYCALVELVHPAKDSVYWMLNVTEEEFFWKVSLDSGAEAAEAICRLLDTYRDAIFNLMVLSCNCSLITLKCLRDLPLPHMDLAFMDEVNLSGVPAWQKFEAAIRSSSHQLPKDQTS